jgi:hypothetical protein
VLSACILLVGAGDRETGYRALMTSKMGRLGSRVGCGAVIGGWAAIASLISAAAFAQVPVQYFVNVQPIDVCASDGSNCAPFNDGIAQIGFADPSTGQDITPAILNQAGINVTYLPVQPFFTGDPTLQTLNVTTIPGCVPGPNQSCLTSAGFKTLSQQPGISGNPPPAIQPTSPLSPDPHTINMFFVTGLTPDPPGSGILYGFSWIGNNGVAIGSDTFGFSVPGVGTFNARPDTIAHELGHDFGLDHTTDNQQQPPENLMSMGSIPRNEPGGVSDIASGHADNLNATQIAQIINPNGVVDSNGNPVLNGFLNAIGGIGAQIADPFAGDDFSVSFNRAGRPNESLKTLTLTAPAGSLLDSSSFSLLNFPGDTSGININPSFLNCSDTEDALCQSLVLTFSGSPFVLGDRIDYSIGVCSTLIEEDSCLRISTNNLAGGTYQYRFSDGYQTTSLLKLSASNLLDADSWNPDPTIPPQIYDEALLVTANAGRLPCVPLPGMTTCPPLDLADANPAEEGGQSPAVPAPEPPSTLILVCALVAVPVVCRFGQITGRYSKPALRRPSSM